VVVTKDFPTVCVKAIDGIKGHRRVEVVRIGDEGFVANGIVSVEVVALSASMWRELADGVVELVRGVNGCHRPSP